MRKLHRLNLLFFLLSLSQCAFLLRPAIAQEKVFQTDYTDIHYSSYETFCDFLWRISGDRYNLCEDPILAKSRIDRIVERVQSILDMHPDNFHIRIDLYPAYEGGLIASYSHKNRLLKIFTDRVTDGVLAHEVAHAVISMYFPQPPPKKIQEILTQYVDKHLWDDY